LLAGCTPSPQVSPSTEVTVPSVSVTPTPQWTEDEQGAIDAVQRYLRVWTEVSENLQTADWGVIRDVAGDPAANNTLLQWGDWAEKGWHIVGGPTFTPDFVTTGALDSQGQRYHVHGCYAIENSYLVDQSGDPVNSNGNQRGPSMYLVLHGTSGTYHVLEDNAEEGTC